MKTVKIFTIIFLYLLGTNNLFSIEPDIFVQSTVNRASKILSEEISKDQKIEQLKLIAKDTVDIRGIGFYTLGSARKNLDENQKKEYLSIQTLR
jgi:phospholipid transport system substrate-binding protein